ncbi:hypothetical protein [Polyangium spumosum]|uniref:Uncharacterized protein n=1 Tax=Polyangium spumosum TaxID=889282 RepID=A0A6N7PZ63_9BACT|nr:hypothetical protein [Polyangium spumosum]MRG95770.1 hypothetical protein [Polyangium spumosum]
MRIGIKGKALNGCDFNERTALAVVDTYRTSLETFGHGLRASSRLAVNAVAAASGGAMLPITSVAPLEPEEKAEVRRLVEVFAAKYFPEYAIEIEDTQPSSAG